MLLGFTLTRIFKLPSETTPAISLNNTSALPLSLIESLAATGTLDTLLVLPNNTLPTALHRAESYFLVKAMISDSLTFAFGPKLLDGEEMPSKSGHTRQDSDHANGTVHETNGHYEDDLNATEQTSLLPTFVVRAEQEVVRHANVAGRKGWSHLPRWTQDTLSLAYDFFHAPLIGVAISALLRLVPPLHKVFFGDPRSGGVFTALLTDRVKKIGDLFPALQVLVVGVKLSSSMRKMKQGEDSGSVPWITALTILFIRFILWPADSISLI